MLKGTQDGDNVDISAARDHSELTARALEEAMYQAGDILTKLNHAQPTHCLHGDPERFLEVALEETGRAARGLYHGHTVEGKKDDKAVLSLFGPGGRFHWADPVLEEPTAMITPKKRTRSGQQASAKADKGGGSGSSTRKSARRAKKADIAAARHSDSGDQDKGLDEDERDHERDDEDHDHGGPASGPSWKTDIRPRPRRKVPTPSDDSEDDMQLEESLKGSPEL